MRGLYLKTRLEKQARKPGYWPEFEPGIVQNRVVRTRGITMQREKMRGIIFLSGGILEEGGGLFDTRKSNSASESAHRRDSANVQ